MPSEHLVQKFGYDILWDEIYIKKRNQERTPPSLLRKMFAEWRRRKFIFAQRSIVLILDAFRLDHTAMNKLALNAEGIWSEVATNL